VQDPGSCEDTKAPNSSRGRQASKQVQQNNNQKDWNALQVIAMSSEIKTVQKILLPAKVNTK